MKKVFFLLIVAMPGLVSVMSAANYRISAELPNSNGKTFYVIDYDNNAIIDSATVADGKLNIQGIYNRDANVRVDGGMEFASCILDSTPVVLDMAGHVPVAGSDLNMRLAELVNSQIQSRNLLMEQYSSMKETLPNDEFENRFNALYDSVNSARLAFVAQTIIENPDNGLGEAALNEFSANCNSAQWDSVCAGVSPRLKNLKRFITTAGRFRAQRETAPGNPFVDIEGKNADGSQARLSDYVGKGKYVLVDFWASWCGPCHTEAESTLKPLYEKYKDCDRFQILGVAVSDSMQQSLEAAEKHGYSWPMILDTERKPMISYGFNSIPMLMLFAPDGTILERDIRGEAVINAVEKIIK